tara:strand:+ start:334 stop:843 length:510 start_codon:yes stop_codon:yes gene_type:complete
MSFSIENTKTIEDTNKLEDSGKFLKFFTPIAIFILGLSLYFVYMFTTSRRGRLARFRDTFGFLPLRNNFIWTILILILFVLFVSNILYLIIYYFLEKKTNKLNEHENKLIDIGIFRQIILSAILWLLLFLIVMYSMNIFQPVIRVLLVILEWLNIPRYGLPPFHINHRQ